MKHMSHPVCPLNNPSNRKQLKGESSLGSQLFSLTMEWPQSLSHTHMHTGRGVDAGHIGETDRGVTTDKTEQWPDPVTTRSLYVCPRVQKISVAAVTLCDHCHSCHWQRRVGVQTHLKLWLYGHNAASVWLYSQAIWTTLTTAPPPHTHTHLPNPDHYLTSARKWQRWMASVAVTTAWPVVTPIRPATDRTGSWDEGQDTHTNTHTDLSHANNSLNS